MKVGHGEQWLEVLPGEQMGGYADRAQGLRGVLDPLEVHVVTFASATHRFALVVADLVCVNTDVVAHIRAAVAELGIDSCWVAATHTHSGPESGCVPGGCPTPPGVATRLSGAAVEAATAAVAAERPASLHHTRTWVPGLAGRRNAGATGAADIPVDALVIRHDETVAGVVTVSPVHPTVLPADNSAASADLNGGIRRVLAAPGRWVVAATGAGGDISTRYTRQGRTLVEIDRLAAMIADRLDLDTVAAPRATTVGMPVSRQVRLAAKPPTDVDAAPPAAVLADARARVVFEQGQRIARSLTARDPAIYDVEIQAVRLGGTTVVAIPGELFLDLGEAIRAAAGDDVVVLGYTNGYLGYLPARDTPPTYETLVSPVRLGSGEQVAEAAARVAAAVRE